MQFHTPRLARSYGLLTVLLVLPLLAAACTAAPAPATSQGISAQDVWARAAKMMGEMPMEGDAHQMEHGGANGAIYMVLANGGTGGYDSLVAAQADVSNSIEIHETVMEGDVMRMNQVEGGIQVPPGGQVELKPGGYHVMLIGLTRDLNAGDKFPVTLEFASGAKLQVEAEVRQP